MNKELQTKIDIFAVNRDTMKEAFPWESGLMFLAAAALYTGAGKRAEKKRLRRFEEKLKERSGIFSEFRGNVKIPLVCKMELSENPTEYFENVESVYKMLNTNKLLGSEYKILAAMTIVDHAQSDEYEAMVARTNEIYTRMKQEHKWLTSDEDMPFAAMLAVSKMDIDTLIDDMEADYQVLKEKFHDTNAVQSLSHVLALDKQSSEAKCEKVEKMFDLLKSSKHKFGSGYELAVLGTMTMLDKTEKEITDLICEVDDYLNTKKGFGDFVLGAKERRLYAAWIVMNEYAPQDDKADTVMLGSMLALTIALEICMIICITSCVSASTH